MSALTSALLVADKARELLPRCAKCDAPAVYMGSGDSFHPAYACGEHATDGTGPWLRVKWADLSVAVARYEVALRSAAPPAVAVTGA